jgi:CheY-like chemotaxis protein/anti-sigma regulatory factor (Ser/Thr protein kinase)
VECLGSIEAQARQKGLDIKLEPGPLAGLSLESDRPKLKQVLANLLSNALRYTERGGIRIVGELSGGRVRISVEDTGVGISPADQMRIFDEYAVLDTPLRKPGEGTGLGLAICRRLAILLRGEITLTSEPGVGSRFTLILPDTTERYTDQTPDGPTLLNKTEVVGAILVAEDHPDSRQTLGRVLKRLGYRVLEASDGKEALALARDEPHLRAVLMDVNMPGMDGIAATLALRADPRLKDVQIFALTGDVTVDNQNRIAEAGVNGFLQKPVTWEALQEALDSTTGHSKSRDRKQA